MSRLTRRSTRITLVCVVALGAIVAGLMVWSSTGVRLSSHTVVSLSRDRVWEFFVDPHNLARWDRSVGRVEPTTAAPMGTGYTFDTISPGPDGEATRSSYRIEDFTPPHGARVDLVGSPQFQRASWHTKLEPVAGGTRVVIEVEFAPKLGYFFLTPMLLLSRGNLMTDMTYLHDEIEAYARRTPS
ncbi:SRPBCC family protein [Actinopolymorpha pittospori]|uniref:Polyketide cyclase / dehydrase and lipid transport n=1 Tax=Actinopolymorpha pittospori TaxID=648752 RepID=A0A927MZ34_9ACTN|nr:SRPBCC family protein [Actinopolymorpha pittospori]MBE1609204.1 hypothetical protein [Actinopolymorpha pittospori]